MKQYLKKDIILIGGGGHCKSCIDVIEQENKFNIIGILDMPDKIGKKIMGYEIVGSDNDVKKYVDKGCYFLITIGQIASPLLRIKIFELLKIYDAKIATIVSPRAYVSSSAMLEEGTIVMHDALINVEVKVGKNCIINSKALVEHEAVISNNCHIAVGAVIAGGAVISENSFIGANSTIVQCSNVPANSFIRANSIFK